MDSFDVWKTFPGGKIVAEKEYRGKERQTGVMDGAKVWRDKGRGTAERPVEGEVKWYGCGC